MREKRRWCYTHDCEMLLRDACYRMLNEINGFKVGAISSLGDRMDGRKPAPCEEGPAMLIFKVKP